MAVPYATEIIYDSHAGREPRQPIELYRTDQQVLDRRAIVRVRRGPDGSIDAVTESIGEYRTGVRRATGVRWFRWSTVSTTQVRRMKSGRFLWSSKSQGRWMASSVDRMNGDQVVLTGGPGHAYVEAQTAAAVAEHLGTPKPPAEVYPLMAHYKSLLLVRDAAFRAAFEGTSDVVSLVAKLYGKRAVRKSLVKAVAEADTVAIYLSWCLRGRHVPIDWHVAYLRTARVAQTFLSRRFVIQKSLRPHLRGLPTRTVRRLMREQIHYGPIADMSRLHAPTAPIPAESWTDLHDRVAAHDRLVRLTEQQVEQDKARIRAERARRLHEKRMQDPEFAAAFAETERRRLETEAERERARDRAIGERAVIWKRLAARLEGSTAGGLTVTVARNDRTLLEWGGRLLLYGEPAKRLLYTDENLEVDLMDYETRGPVLRQLLGFKNRTLSRHVHDDLLDHLAAAGVHTPEHYQGRIAA